MHVLLGHYSLDFNPCARESIYETRESRSKISYVGERQDLRMKAETCESESDILVIFLDKYYSSLKDLAVSCVFVQFIYLND